MHARKKMSSGQLTIRKQFMIALIGLNMLIIAVISIVSYVQRRAALLASIDARLFAVATLAKELLPADYHDRIFDPSSVPDETYHAIVDRNNRLCKTLGMEYIWSLMRLDGKTVFTTATSPDKVVSNGQHAAFLETHTNPDFYTEAFQSARPLFRICHDKWGDIRVALLPARDAHGRPYLFGASVRLTDVDRQLVSIVWRSLAIGLATFLFNMGIGIWVANWVTGPLHRLTETIQRIAAGQTDVRAEECGSYEQVTLARHFNQMNSLLQEKIAELEVSRAHLIDERDTERQQAKEARAIDEQRYHALLNFAVDGILIGSHEGVITDANECMCQLFGLDRSAIIGKMINEMPFTPESLHQSPFNYASLFCGQVVVSERTIRRSDGSETVVEMRTKMMPDGTLQSIYRDVTERKKQHALLESWNAALERRVAERTQEVAQYTHQLQALTGRLIQAEEAERQRISHVLHEDLQQILVAARMTLGGAAGEGGARTAIARVDEMLAQSLRVSRSLVEGIAIPGVNERDVLFAARWLAKRMQESFGLQVNIACEESAVFIERNTYICLYRVMQELLFNVVKHAGVSQAEIEIRSEPDHLLRVVVGDAGRGFSLSSMMSAEPERLHFGLFSLRERVEGLGGSLDVVSAPGQGSRVTIVFHGLG